MKPTRVFLTAVVLLSCPAKTSAESQSQGVLICTPEREQDCLDKMKGIASRTGDILRITSANGEKKTYESNPKACQNDNAKECVRYSLAAYAASSGYVSVRAGLYEGDAGEIINLKTGRSLTLDSSPAFSPDGRRFVVVPDTVHYGFDYRFAIWRLSPTGPVREFVSKPSPKETLYWYFQRWVDSRQVLFELDSWNGDDPAPVTASLVRNRWRLDKPKP